MEKTNVGLLEYAKAQLGLPYWMGTTGQIASEYIYESNKARLPQYYTATDFPLQYGLRVHDCIGLIKGYLWSATPTSPPDYCSEPCTIDHSADSMLTACTERGTIDTIPEIVGLLVFFQGHVGIYIGNGNVIEARGHKYGVVQTRLVDRPWKSWGKCPYITYNKTENEDENMTGEEIITKVTEYLKEQPCPEWAKSELQEAIDLGITDGTNPMCFIPRYQAAIMALRAMKKAQSK